MNAQLMTAAEGEAGFNFDKWITNNALQDIKHLFIKHHATTQQTLQFTSSHFSALLSDPQLLQKWIPKIMKAMQTVHAPKTAKKQRIVITEMEENAMVNAQKENEKMGRDINRFNALIKNTNNSKRESEQKINIQFDEIIKALRVRQKELLRKLENMQTNKIKKLEKQVNILKVCGKQYNDLEQKWQQMLHNENIERNDRKQQIVNAANLSSENAKKLQNENQKIFATESDKFAAQFEAYKAFVDGFGTVCSGMAAPIISLLNVAVQTAKFAVQCVGGVADEKKEEFENEYIYQVEWSADCKGNEEDDDEKYEWEMREFEAVPIEIDNLLRNTKYGIRCKLKSRKRNICSSASQILLFNTKNAEMFEIKRGDIIDGGWTYYGDSNALSFMSDKNIIFYGIAVFDCGGTVDAKYKIFEGDNKDNDNNIIAHSKQKSFTKDAMTNAPIRFDLDEPININKDTKYTIQLEQKNNGSGSYQVISAKTTVTIKGVTITFSKASNSPNTTGVNGGAFPILYCAV